MAAIDDPKTLGRARLSFAKESDIDEFADMLGKFETRRDHAPTSGVDSGCCAAPTGSGRPTTRT